MLDLSRSVRMSKPDIVRIDRLKIFLDSMGGGAWPFLVGGVICLVNSVNERDLDLLNSYMEPRLHGQLLGEVWGNNRSVMPSPVQPSPVQSSQSSPVQCSAVQSSPV